MIAFREARQGLGYPIVSITDVGKNLSGLGEKLDGFVVLVLKPMHLSETPPGSASASSVAEFGMNL